MEGKDQDSNPIINNNGVWTNTTLNIPELIATYMKVWFEDSVPDELMKSMANSRGQYTEEKQREILSKVYENIVAERKVELEAMISSFEAKLPQ
jgi:hypothetical protein